MARGHMGSEDVLPACFFLLPTDALRGLGSSRLARDTAA
jgi:hypothetical protein